MSVAMETSISNIKAAAILTINHARLTGASCRHSGLSDSLCAAVAVNRVTSSRPKSFAMIKACPDRRLRLRLKSLARCYSMVEESTFSRNFRLHSASAESHKICQKKEIVNVIHMYNLLLTFTNIRILYDILPSAINKR